MKYIGNILYDEVLLDKDKKFVIYGAGTYGKRILSYLELNQVQKQIICFCDSNNKVAGQSIQGIPIVSPSLALVNYPDVDYLISGKYAKEIYGVLKENSIKKIHWLFL